MSIARKVGVWFGVFLFTTFLSLGLMTFSLEQLTRYDVLEPAFSEMAVAKMTEAGTDIQSSYRGAQLRCGEPDTTELPLQNGLSLKCPDVLASSAENFPALMARVFFDSIYYKKYDCSFIVCLRTLPKAESAGLIFTEKAHLFLAKVWAYMFLVSALAAALLFACAEKGSSRLKAMGFCFFITGTPYFLFGLIEKLVPRDVATQAAPLIKIMVSTLSGKFLIALVAGILMIVAGFALGWAESKLKPKK